MTIAMISALFPLLVAGGALSGSAVDTGTCAEDIAQRLLVAIQAGDAREVAVIANNSDVFDADAIATLTADSQTTTSLSSGRMSARVVLEDPMIITKVISSTGPGGRRDIEVVFLPSRTASSLGELTQKVTKGEARMFSEYIACALVDTGKEVYMPHACYAETDLLE